MSSVFKYSHWCLSTRHQDSIRELEYGDIDASQNAMKQPRTDEFIDRPVEVLSATVGQHRGRTVLQTLRGGEQDFGGDARIEGRRDLPSQDAA